MRAEKTAALIERDRVRKYALHIGQLYAFQSKQVVPDTQVHLAADEEITREQQVVMFGDRASQRVLDRNNRGLDLARFDRLEDLGRAGAGYDGSLGQHFASCFVAERT